MIRIITDSAADFEPWELEKLNITCIPITVMFGEEEYQENLNLTKDQFYELLLRSGHTPKTAQPSPQLLMDLFESAQEAQDEAIYITLSSALSGTYQNALMSRNLVGYEKSYVVDGLNATGGQRLLLEYAARLRDQGKTAQEAMQEVGAVVEGYYAVKSAYELGKAVGVEMPIVEAAYKVLYKGASAREAVQELLVRSRKAESENPGWL